MPGAALNELHLQYNGPSSADNKVLLTVIDWYIVEMIPLGDVIFCAAGGVWPSFERAFCTASLLSPLGEDTYH